MADIDELLQALVMTAEEVCPQLWQHCSGVVEVGWSRQYVNLRHWSTRFSDYGFVISLLPDRVTVVSSTGTADGCFLDDPQLVEWLVARTREFCNYFH